ncbi:MAG: NAD-dependent epimerase/dehydratase family protein [Leptolyngbya sp. SIOISBB]|nr:NAD-dependent epimerase/dehydratase family protein [Leptolyngbya sp. SIOISBB]
MGRTDHQVKLRGFRIELGEIESVLQQHPEIRQAVVTVQGDSSQAQLIAYVVLQSRQSLNLTDLRSFCLRQLPDYMVPAVFVSLKTLPLTSNGKVDRQALPAPDQSRLTLDETYIAPRTPTEERLAEIWAEVLHLDRVGIADNFFELGGHSLLITQLLAQVRDLFQIDLPLRSLFEWSTVADLANYIDRLQSPDINATSRFENEITLDPVIYPTSDFSDQLEPTHIFLTGATGFLGAFLLHELLQQTSAKIYCLIRATDADAGWQKIRNHLTHYQLWHDRYTSRLIIIVGDLAQPLLGLPPKQFGEIANQIDVIYHNGALVNFTYPYTALKAVNVLGTQEVLRLSCQGKTKPIHYVSTIGTVAVSSESADRLDGYTQSKWVAEQLVTLAKARGLPVCIYRPGRIAGHSESGICNPDDHTFRLIRGCLQLGIAPKRNLQVNLAPVDYVSRAIAHLSLQPDARGKTYHLVNPDAVPWNQVIQWIHECGYPLQLVSLDQWQQSLQVVVTAQPDHPLYPLIPMLTTNASGHEHHRNHQPPATKLLDPFESDLAQQLTQATLRELNHAAIVCPAFDRPLLKTYLTYLAQEQYLKSPSNQVMV